MVTVQLAEDVLDVLIEIIRQKSSTAVRGGTRPATSTGATLETSKVSSESRVEQSPSLVRLITLKQDYQCTAYNILTQ